MAKKRTAYACQSCGASHPKWVGRCGVCDEWHSVVEEILPPPGELKVQGPGAKATPLTDVSAEGAGTRLQTGIKEVDRVLGGGLFPGSAVLLGGAPGIGKSTLVLQMLASLGAVGKEGLYVSGEESAYQIRSRADRLGVKGAGVHLMAEVELERMAPEITRLSPALLVVDSIQTVRSNELDSTAGTVSQVRAAAAQLIQHAKTTGSALLLIGHVTKEGAIAGPRLLEHMVDVVLYLEGEGERTQRVLRSVKNRFGAVHEIGLFQMTPGGLEGVDNPSSLFLAERTAEAPGTVVFAGMEGTRPLLIEIQALVGETASNYPRRTAVGMDVNRAGLLQAVIEKHLGGNLSGLDVYLNVVGGLRLSEPALDAAVVAAMLSSFRRVPIPIDTVVFGEVGLTGEFRAVPFMPERLAEAARLGFSRAVVPGRSANKVPKTGKLEVITVPGVKELAEALFP